MSDRLRQTDRPSRITTMPHPGFDSPRRPAARGAIAAAAAPLPIPAVWLGVVAFSAAVWVCLIAVVL